MLQAILELADFTCGFHLAQAFASKKNFNMSALKSLLQASMSVRLGLVDRWDSVVRFIYPYFTTKRYWQITDGVRYPST
jgi:hypothetical protein